MIYSSLSALLLSLILLQLLTSSPPSILFGGESANEAPEDVYRVPLPLVLLVEVPPDVSSAFDELEAVGEALIRDVAVVSHQEIRSSMLAEMEALNRRPRRSSVPLVTEDGV